MELESVTLKLPRDLLSGAQRVATARDVTIGHMVRQLLKREVNRQLSSKGESGPDSRLIAAVEALLSRDMAAAADWHDLARRLRPHGYMLRATDEGTVLCKSSCGTRLCKTADIGFDYDALITRFGGPMPEITEYTPRTGSMPAGRIDPTRHGKLHAHISTARNWPDLINRLAVEGMELRHTGAELGIFVTATGRHLCNTATIGAHYATLVDRYRSELPDHRNDGSQRGCQNTAAVETAGTD